MEQSDFHFSNEGCHACKHSIGTTVTNLAGHCNSTEDPTFLWCNLREEFPVHFACQCPQFEREPGADYPSEVNEKVTAAFLNPYLIQKLKLIWHDPRGAGHRAGDGERPNA